MIIDRVFFNASLLLTQPCWCVLQIVAGGIYKVSVMYTSQVQATFKLAVGLYSNIEDGTAPSLTAKLPVTVSANGLGE